MGEASCPHCGKSLEALKGAVFCPFCGVAVQSGQPSGPQDSEEVRSLLQKVKDTEDPRKKHTLLVEAEKRFPRSLAVAQELLFLGRLYERGGKAVDFSVIKSYLLMLYLEPSRLSAEEKNRFRQELFAHPQLQKCLSLCEDERGFLRMYLLRLEGEFIGLFLRGDSRYMRRIFGFSLDSRAAKLLAEPVACMIVNMQRDAQLEPWQSDMLVRTLYQAFSKDMNGETQWLEERLAKEGVSLSDRA